jgi:alkylation response protein AidB-like acyl-CoA dehydrogenase
MALLLNEEQELLRDSAHDFLAERSPVQALRALRDAGEEWSPDLWQELAEMGWTGIAVPEEFGGLGFGYVGAGLVLEQCGRTLLTSPLLSSTLVCAALIERLGDPEQKAALLPELASGETIMTLAVKEGPRLDPAATALSARAEGNGYLLNGSKAGVLDARMAQRMLVVARTGEEPGAQEGLSVFVVDTDAAGLAADHTLNLDNHRSTQLTLSDVRIGAEACLGEPGRAWAAVQHALDVGAIGASAELLGLSREAFERTMAYLKERKQFGVPIGSFQALQHRAAELFTELELCRALVLRALQALDEAAADLPMLASAAKARCGDTARLAVNEAVQMHGGIGMTDEYDIGFFMKRAAAARQEYGDSYYHANRFAAIRGY